MAPNQIFAAINRQPFRPFRIHTSAGASAEVRHPEMCFVSIRTTVVHASTEDDPTGTAQPVTIDNLYITRLEQLPVPADHSANGPA